MSSPRSGSPVDPLLYNSENLRTFIGIMVERAGGVVVLTEDEVNASIHGKRKQLYVEVSDNSIRFEVIPDGGA